MNTAVMQSYETGVLDPAVHGRLLQNLGLYARRANIPETMILHKMSQFDCSSDEIDYVRAIKRQAAAGHYGLVYTGDGSTVLTRMMGVAGACVRNFVDAKLMTIQELLAKIKEGDVPDASVLLVPNFFIAKSEGGHIAAWNIAELLGVLFARMAKGQQTFLYVSDFKALRMTYGEAIADHLENHFVKIDA